MHHCACKAAAPAARPCPGFCLCLKPHSSICSACTQTLQMLLFLFATKPHTTLVLAVQQCLRLGNARAAERVRQIFKLPDKRFGWIKVGHHSYRFPLLSAVDVRCQCLLITQGLQTLPKCHSWSFPSMPGVSQASERICATVSPVCLDCLHLYFQANPFHGGKVPICCMQSAMMLAHPKQVNHAFSACLPGRNQPSTQ